MNKLYSFGLMLFIAISATSIVQAQSKKAIILIDGSPKEVLLSTDGTVLEVIKDLPNYLDGVSTTNDYHPSNEYVIPADYDLNPGSKYIEHEMIRLGAFRIIYFPTGKASFSEATVDKLREIAQQIKNTGQRALLQSFYNQSDTSSKQLVSNRVIACKQFLTLNGVSEDQVVFAVESATQERAKINVFLK